MIFNSKLKCFVGVLTIAILAGVATSINAAVGESAVITLVFPPGARATALGEAFTGLSDDANATFFNPAGLGQAPLANSWKMHQKNSEYNFTSIAAKKRKDFGSKDLIWVGTNKGLLRYNGKAWENYEIYLIEQKDDLNSIVSKYMKIDDPKLLSSAVWSIMKFNKLSLKHFESCKVQIQTELQNKKVENAVHIADSLAKEIVMVPVVERSSAKIYALISGSVDSLRADTLSDQLSSVFLGKDITFSDVDELKIPFSIATTDSITCLTIDNSDRLWAGTENGLWRYSNNEWNRYTVLDGLPSNLITSIATSSNGHLSIGTDNGIANYIDGQWKKLDTADGLPAARINTLAYGLNNALYAGTQVGLVKTTDSTITVYDTSNGLLANEVRSLFYDSDERLWIGCDNGVTISTQTSWKRFKFPGSKVVSFTEHKNGNIWIGTNRGVISYKAGRTEVDKNGVSKEGPPEWKSFHSKNVLSDDDVRSLIDHNNDIWIATGKGINEYDNAQREVFLFYEQLLPDFNIPDLWHAYAALVYPTEDWGTIGGFVNYIMMGNNTPVDALGHEGKARKSWEGVFGISYGIALKEDFSLGINIKYINSALAPGMDEGQGVGRTFAVDASLLKRNLFFKNFDLGFMLQNMGPNIFYVDKNDPDPLPFTLRLGLVYRPVQTPVHDLKLLVDLNREFVNNKFDGKPDPFWKALFTDLTDTANGETFGEKMQEINVNLGLEYWYANFVALRTGFLADYIGVRYEWTLGLGIKYGTLNADWSYIYSPEGFMKGVLKHTSKGSDGSSGVRNGQWRVSFLFHF